MDLRTGLHFRFRYFVIFLFSLFSTTLHVVLLGHIDCFNLL